MNKKTLGHIIWLCVFLITAAAVVSVRLYYEYLQYLDIGYKYTTIFFTNLRIRFVSFAVSFLIVFGIILANNIVIRHIAYKYNDDWDFIKKPIYTFITAFLLSLLASTLISGAVYENVITFMYSVPFGSTDPLFGKDIGYYMFVRPFYISVIDGVKSVMGLNIVYTVLVYTVLWMRGGIGGLRDMVKNRHVSAHTLVNIMLFTVITALGYKFNIEELMYKSFCGVTGAGASHMKVWYPYYKIAPFMLIITVPLGLYFLQKKKFRRAAWTVAAFPIVWFAAVFTAVTYQTMFVDSDELSRESEYLAYNMEYTKRAYGLDNVTVQSAEPSAETTESDMGAIVKTAESSDISDTSAMLDVYNSEQMVSSEYRFYGADIVPYMTDGERKTVCVSAREISDEAKSADRTYSGSKFLNTFGSGMVMTSSAERGKYFIYGVPAVTGMGIAGIANDRIYYGENENTTVVVNTAYDGENYIGVGGVQLTALNRFVIGVCSGDFRLTANRQITPKSRAVMNRNIVERVKKIAPFFEYDSDPYMIVDDNGVMKWVMDAYSVSDKYPYSQKTGAINYISPCAKVIIDAYSGVVDFYVINSKEPMMRMYKSIYPYVFSDGSIPDSIKNYMRYPKDILNIQASVYRRYYTDDIKELYSGASKLDGVRTKDTGSTFAEPWYMVKNEKAQLIIPFTRDGDSICAFMSASCEASDYGQLTMTHINGKGFDTVAAVQNIINSSTDVTKHINELGKNGAAVRQGAVRIIPVNNTVVYAAPLYVTGADGTSTTSVSDVIVVMNGRAAVSSDIETAAKTLIAHASVHEAGTDEESTVSAMVDELIALYNRVRLYQRAGDYENYGRAMKEFDTVIRELEKKSSDNDFEQEFVGPRAEKQ